MTEEEYGRGLAPKVRRDDPMVNPPQEMTPAERMKWYVKRRQRGHLIPDPPRWDDRKDTELAIPDWVREEVIYLTGDYCENENCDSDSPPELHHKTYTMLLRPVAPDSMLPPDKIGKHLGYAEIDSLLDNEQYKRVLFDDLRSWYEFLIDFLNAGTGLESGDLIVLLCGFEEPEDLLALCPKCHDSVHYHNGQYWRPL